MAGRPKRKAAAEGRAKMLKIQQAEEHNTDDDFTMDGSALEGREEKEQDCSNTNISSIESASEDSVEEDEEDEDLQAQTSTSPPRKSRRQNLPAVTPSPSSKRGSCSSASSTICNIQTTTKPKTSPPRSSPMKKWNPRSVAIRGLPRGALARCAVTGFTVRTLDGIQPLKEASWSSAKMPLLPGRLLVTHVPPNMVTVKEMTGILDQTFDSATDLGSFFRATYAMEAVSDPTFASFEFVQSRLESAGLLDGGAEDFIPPMVVQLEYDGNASINGCILLYDEYVNATADPNTHLWGMVENDGKTVVVGVLPTLLESSATNVTPHSASSEVETESEIGVAKNEKQLASDDQDSTDYFSLSPDDIIPQLKPSDSRIRLAASLLEKSIRRGSGLCSITPLLEASHTLLCSQTDVGGPIPGATLAFLNTAWKSIIVDASPLESNHSDCLGEDALCLLSIVARVDPLWQLPKSLKRAAIAGVARVASSAKNQTWIGHVKNNEHWYKLEHESKADQLCKEFSEKDKKFRNILRVCQSAVGGRLAWTKWNKFVGDPSAAAVMGYLNSSEWDGSQLEQAHAQAKEERRMLDRWERGNPFELPVSSRFRTLDDECRRAAIDPNLFPHSLVILQALLKSPPTSWKKHGLPSLSRQVRKLISEVNPRYQERIQLQRLETWGKVAMNQIQPKVDEPSIEYKTYHEAATTTGSLSEQESELVECYETVQQWQMKRFSNKTPSNETKKSSSRTQMYPVQVGKPLSMFDGRMAFLLLFGFAIEVDVFIPNRPAEKVGAMFCGTPEEPLLVQRIGNARKEGRDLAVSGGSMSGASAVPSLGYVQKSRSENEAALFEAAEKAVAEYWKKGHVRCLPLPPPLFQWEVGKEQRIDDGWDNGDPEALLCAYLSDEGWKFSADGVEILPFDARGVVSSCSLEINDKDNVPVPLEPDSRRSSLLNVALYVMDDNQQQPNENLPHGNIILDALIEMQRLAKEERGKEMNEGRVFDWLHLAAKSPIPSRTWRDALLAIRTRDSNHILLGKGIQRSGGGSSRDMTEGVLLRIFHVLEFLYPTALRKDGALSFRVRPRGASFYHMMSCLEKLSISTQTTTIIGKGKIGTKRSTEVKTEELEASPAKKRPKRSAAKVASKKFALAASASLTEDGNVDNLLSIDKSDGIPVPSIITKLWPHQQATVDKIVKGVGDGKRGHADASSVGAGKTLTALSTIVALQCEMKKRGLSRQGVLVMLPSKALIKEWLLEVATHSRGLHVIEQREDGSLFSLTYGKTHPPIDTNALVISTLDRVSRHPFVRDGVCWDLVVIDECLAVQNSSAKRNPSAWRQIETSTCGVLMLSATFFRSKFDQLFYMIRMLRSPLPRTMEYLPATIHEHIVCQVPESDRSWEMKVEWAGLKSDDMNGYRKIIDAFKRKQLNEGVGDGRLLWSDLESFLRQKYEGRVKNVYTSTSIMGDAFVTISRKLVRQERKPLVFADTVHESEFLLRVLNENGLRALSWASITSQNAPLEHIRATYDVIVASKFKEAQGINMQRHADCIVCRPTPGDLLEQMKGRIDRYGQSRKDLLLVVVVAEHTIEEVKFANIRLAGNFFREYIAPVATKYRERFDLEAALSITGTKILKRGTVSGVWRKSLESAGQSGTFAETDGVDDSASTDDGNDGCPAARKIEKKKSKYKPLNKVIRNKGDQVAIREAKESARRGNSSVTVRNWLFPSKNLRSRTSSSGTSKAKPLPMFSLLRFSDVTPPLVLNRETVDRAVAHLSKHDDKLAALIARVGADALAIDCGRLKPMNQASLFDSILRAITFTMISVDAGNAFLRKLAIKAAVCLEGKSKRDRKKILDTFVAGQDSSMSTEKAIELLEGGRHKEVRLTHDLLRELINECEIDQGKQTGYPHLCGISHPCGKDDDPRVFLTKARNQAKGTGAPVSAGFSRPKASFIIAAVEDVERGILSASKLMAASDRKACDMLMKVKGIGDWSAGQVMMHTLKRADIMLYGDLTVRNYLNDLYDLGHHEASETWLESAADFPDNGPNRNAIDDLATKNNWGPYRSVICYLMYHLDEENLVLL